MFGQIFYRTLLSHTSRLNNGPRGRYDRFYQQIMLISNRWRGPRRLFSSNPQTATSQLFSTWLNITEHSFGDIAFFVFPISNPGFNKGQPASAPIVCYSERFTSCFYGPRVTRVRVWSYFVIRGYWFGRLSWVQHVHVCLILEDSVGVTTGKGQWHQ